MQKEMQEYVVPVQITENMRVISDSPENAGRTALSAVKGFDIDRTKVIGADMASLDIKEPVLAV